MHVEKLVKRVISGINNMQYFDITLIWTTSQIPVHL